MEKFKASQDIDGNESSKRKKGMLLIDIAISMAAFYFIIGVGMDVFKKEFEYKFPLEIWYTIIGLGTSLLGITLAERVKFSKK